jgi:hypothetical protein
VGRQERKLAARAKYLKLPCPQQQRPVIGKIDDSRDGPKIPVKFKFFFSFRVVSCARFSTIT